MTAQMVLEKLKNQRIEIKAENGKIFARPRVPEHLKAEIKAHKAEIMVLLSPPHDLAAAYRHYWNIPPDASTETFKALHRKIDLIENQVGADAAWKILEASARTWYQEHRVCPFCKHPGVLHLASGLSR